MPFRDVIDAGGVKPGARTTIGLYALHRVDERTQASGGCRRRRVSNIVDRGEAAGNRSQAQLRASGTSAQGTKEIDGSTVLLALLCFIGSVSMNYHTRPSRMIDG